MPKDNITDFINQHKNEGITIYMLLLSWFNILISKLSGEEDIIIGTPTAGRDHQEIEKTLGMFVNTLALRNKVPGAKSFVHFLREVKNNTLKAFENQHYQFETLVDKLNLPRDVSRNPLFDIIFVFQNVEVKTLDTGADNQNGSFQLEPVHSENINAKYDLALEVYDSANEFSCTLIYSTKLFKKETIESFITFFRQIISATTLNPEKKIREIDMISAEQKNKILFEFNSTEHEYPSEKTIHELFEEQVDKTPNYVALAFDDEKISYKYLNERSNQLSNYLINLGLKESEIVGILVSNPVVQAVSIMGILKSGATYLPIDPDYPTERIEYIITNSKLKYLITTSNIKHSYTNSISLINIVSDIEKINDLPVINQAGTVKSDNSAYIVYTSGTTGNPKGALVSHKSAVNTLYFRKNELGLNEKMVIIQLFSYSFDGYMVSFFTPLIGGSRIVMVKYEETKNIELLKKIVQYECVNYILSVPSLFQYLVHSIAQNEKLPCLRIVDLAGESIPKGLFENAIKKLPNLEICQEYGVTEASVSSTIYRHQEKDPISKIGKPHWNTKVYILDKYNNVQPIGIAGELCIGGAGLAKGYINNDQLTKEKFVDNPFITGEKIYKSGDLARWLHDGNIEFIGRLDHQVKIRGFRIELAEIEYQLADYPEIKEAVVIVTKNNHENYIVAFYVAEHKIESNDLKMHLRKKLPEYMLPSQFVHLKKVPLTPNQKIDRKALEAIKSSDEEKYVGPKNKLEKELVLIWSEVLHKDVKEMSTNKSFFEIGGHSLNATVLIEKIYNAFNIKIPLAKIFQIPTVEGISEYITTVKWHKDDQNIPEPNEKVIVI